MKKSLVILLLLPLLCAAQQTVLFHENFDLPSGPDSVTVSATWATNPIIWNDTSFLSVSPTQSFHVQYSAQSRVSFETQSFSTIGADHVYLTFNHIAKTYNFNTCKVYVSKDNGTTWNLININHYLGPTSAFNASGTFSDYTFSATTDIWNFNVHSGPNSIPQSSWWLNQMFDITSLTKDSVGAGYGQVKVKFEAHFPNLSPNGIPAGWFVDDVTVISAPCENVPPEISLHDGTQGGVNCPDSLMAGAYTYSPTFNLQKLFVITDNAQVDSVRLLEIVNGVPRPYVVASGMGFGHFFTGYNSTDTVEWVIEAYDTCGNMGRFPKTGYHTFYFRSLPQKCQTGDCEIAHRVIDTFPWSENFESPSWVLTGSRGGWPNNSFYIVNPPLFQTSGWTLRSAGTPTSDSGPLADHTTGLNGKYLYSKFQGYPIVTNTVFISPCIDLTDSVSRTFSFYYHMYGSDIDGLAIGIDTSTVTSPGFFNTVVLNGQQQNSSADPWKKALISLEPYRGKIIKIRLSARRNPSSTLKSDIAIDDLEINDALATDVELLAVSSPQPVECGSSSGLNVDIDILNKGYVNLPEVPVAYQLDNGTVVSDTLVTSGFALGDTLNFVFNQTLSFNPGMAHTLKVWTDVPGDTDRSSDTITINIANQLGQLINSFPYFLNFSNARATGLFGDVNTQKWTLNTTNLGTFWNVDSGYFSNNTFGPARAHGPKGKAITNKGIQYVTGDYARMESGCIDFSGLSNPEISFQYFAHADNYLEVLVREPGQPWTKFNIPRSSITPKERFIGYRISLAGFAGKSVQIAFQVNAGIGDKGVAVDDILIQDHPTTDLALRDVELTRLIEGKTTYGAPKAHYTNWAYGFSGPNHYARLKVKLIDKCNPLAAPIYGESDSLLMIALSLPLNGTQVFPNLTFGQPIPRGEYLAKYWLESNGDQFIGNDTAYVNVVCQRVVVPPYFNDFEACDPGIFTNGSNNQWEIATPQKAILTGVHGGSKCAVTNADTNILVHFTNGPEIMELPGLTGLDTLFGVEIRLWQNFDFGTNNSRYGTVEIFNGTNYAPLYNPSISGYNWGSLMQQVGPPYNLAFTGSSNGWVYSSYPMIGFNPSGPTYIRFSTHASEVPGWAIDDLEIYVPPQNSGSPKQLIFNNSIPQNGANSVSIKVQNTGFAPLNEVELFIEENGNVIHSETITLASPLGKDKIATVPLSSPLNLTPSMQQLLIRTNLPNHRLDVIPTDDTLLLSIQLQTGVQSDSTCFGFESGNDFLAFDLKNSIYDTTWVRGLPAKSTISTAHTGTNAWYVKGSNYNRMLNQYLYTPVFSVDDNACYRLSFWQNFDTELNFDGGNVEFTLDSGATWQTLGYYWSTDSLWYNTQYIQSLDGFKPGFSGNSGGWVQAQKDFKVFGNTSVQFRFRFASNASISGEGWAIDDVCLEKTGSNCETVGLNEPTPDGVQVTLYPVPSQSLIYLSGDLSGEYEFTIFDQRGSAIQNWTQKVESHEPTSISIDRLAPGVYWLQLKGGKQPVVRKFIKE